VTNPFTVLGNFIYHNPTKIYFGEGSLRNLSPELKNYGKRIMLIYGKGSIKKNGIYDQVMDALKSNGCEVVEDPGVMPNPTLDKLMEGARIAEDNDVDLIIAVGGGSCCDYAKAVAVSAHCDADPWQKYYINKEDPDCKIIPVACILTMAGTGSEMNAGSVITNQASKMKITRIFGDYAMPKFSILDPSFTKSLPKRQLNAGIYDTFNHLCEQYFSGEDDNVSDDIAEALMRLVVRNSRTLMADPDNDQARSNLMWSATLALNTLTSRGKSTDWMIHMIGKAIGAYTDETHGMTLSAVTLPYYRYIMDQGLHRFVRFAVNVWDVDPAGKTDKQTADEGLAQLESWMKELELAMDIGSLGVTEDMIDRIADSTLLTKGGYRQLNRDDIVRILHDSM